MDAPPDKEDCAAFIRISQLLRKAEVNAPEILAQDLEQGFLLLSDLGEQIYLDHLFEDRVNTLYMDAIRSLIKMQSIQADLPPYNDQLLRSEMDLFEPWYLNKHLEIKLNASQKNDLEATYTVLINNAAEQPQVFVHRDYHSRNLMLVSGNNPGVIDFQDAVIGPVTYDLVSLFKDCYIEWSRGRVEHWLEKYLAKSNVINVDEKQFMKWFDLMGVQRHLKVLGIFSRLNYRDGKDQYLNDLPLVLKYVLDACHRYDELAPLKNLLEQTVLRDLRATS